MSKRLVVIGGGISGLAAAHAAWRRREEVPDGLDVVVLESGPEAGGKARTFREDGWLVEEGPTGYLDDDGTLDELVAAAGIEKMPAQQASARRFVVRDARMREIQAHPMKFLSSGILGPGGMLWLLREPWVKRTQAEDETVFDFARRRLGPQVAERLIAPMVLGVFAGDARKISLPAAFPKMASLEREHGSLIRAMLAKGRQAKEKQSKGGPSGPAGTLTSFADGLQALPRALADASEFPVAVNKTVTAVRKVENGWQVDVEGESEPMPADAVVLATECYAAADLLRESAPEVAGELDAIPTPPVTVVALGYGAEALAKVPVGFGVLIPRGEGFTSLGVLWDTHLFPGRSPEGSLLVRSMVGGSTEPDKANQSDDELVAAVKKDMQRLFGVTEEPTRRHIVRWPRAIPQYELGHLARVRRIEQQLARLSGLHMAGNGLYGVAFSKSAVHGWKTGGQVIQDLGRSVSTS